MIMKKLFICFCIISFHYSQAQIAEINEITDSTNSGNHLKLSIVEQRYTDTRWKNGMIIEKVKSEEYLKINDAYIKDDLHTDENIARLFKYCPTANDKFNTYLERDKKISKSKNKFNLITLGAMAAGVGISAAYLEGDNKVYGITGSLFGGLVLASVNGIIQKSRRINNHSLYRESFYDYMNDCYRIDLSLSDTSIVKNKTKETENATEVSVKVSATKSKNGTLPLSNSSSDTMAINMFRNNPEKVKFWGINIHPLSFEVGGSLANMALSGELFYMYKGLRIYGNYNYIYTESGSINESNAVPSSSNKSSYSFGAGVSIPLIKSYKESSQDLDLGYSKEIQFNGNIKLKTLRYVAVEASYTGRNYLNSNIYSTIVDVNSDRGDELVDPSFYVKTNGLKGGLSYNYFNSYDYEPQDARFNYRKQNTYHVSFGVNIIYNNKYRSGTLLFEEEVVSVNNLTYNNIGVAAFISRNAIKKYSGLSISLEIGYAPGYKAYNNEFLNIKLGKTFGGISYN